MSQSCGHVSLGFVILNFNTILTEMLIISLEFADDVMYIGNVEQGTCLIQLISIYRNMEFL